MEIIEISISVVIITVITKYINYILDICGIFLPQKIYFILELGIALSVIQYIISRKDD